MNECLQQNNNQHQKGVALGYPLCVIIDFH